MIPEFGNTTAIEYLDSSQISVSAYFGPMVKAAVSWGYTRGKDLRGAPFDFRKAPSKNAYLKEAQHFCKFYKNFL